ncbi:MAG: FAD-dependent monooxygenase [Rhodobacteraceae bacterium]|nr:FAD-dependent monooxygenase [Paracoccaceae bacterium]
MPPPRRIFAPTLPPGLARSESGKQVVIVGAGPVGLAAAIELANHNIATVVLDDNNQVATGSRAICWSKRSLEIFDRLHIGDRAVAKGVTWQIGRTFHGNCEIFSFDLLPEEGHKRPAFINLQQYYVEDYLLDVALASDLIDLRFCNTVTGIALREDDVLVTIETQSGPYHLSAAYLIACDGASSTVRSCLGLSFHGTTFEERFLIADIEMETPFPPERRFWFEPAFHPGQSALLHKQPDNIYRIDLQLGPTADPEHEQQHGRVRSRIEKIVGTRSFRIDWVSVYVFKCCRLENLVHERVIFAGDSAHVLSPFGARGGNSGLQDIDALCWRLAAVLKSSAPAAILNDYNSERLYAADENMTHTVRATRFMTPATPIEQIFRNQVLRLAACAPFARAWVNSGRLSTPAVYPMPDPLSGILPAVTRPGSVAADAPLADGWLMDRLRTRPTLLFIGSDGRTDPDIPAVTIQPNAFITERYLGDQPAAVYLIRPDQVIANRWLNPTVDEIARAQKAVWTHRHAE